MRYSIFSGYFQLRFSYFLINCLWLFPEYFNIFWWFLIYLERKVRAWDIKLMIGVWLPSAVVMPTFVRRFRYVVFVMGQLEKLQVCHFGLKLLFWRRECGILKLALISNRRLEKEIYSIHGNNSSSILCWKIKNLFD